MSIIPLVKSANLLSIDNASKKLAGAPSITVETLFIKEKNNNTAVPTTAATIWLLDKEDPNNPIERAAAPYRIKPIYALKTGPESGVPKIYINIT